MHLHNHIKEDHQDNKCNMNNADWQPLEQLTTNGDRTFPLVSDNNEPNHMLVVDVQLVRIVPKNRASRFDIPLQFFCSFWGCMDHYILV